MGKKNNAASRITYHPLRITDHGSRPMGKITTHKDLDVWKEAMNLAKQAYFITSNFPKEEIYGLTSQIRRAAVSIPSNIAEGAARNSHKEFIQFLYIALGSVAELETQLLLARELGLVKDITLNITDSIERQRKLLLGLIRALKKRNE